MNPSVIKQFLAESILQSFVRDCNFTQFCDGLVNLIIKAIPCEAATLFELNQEAQSLFFRSTFGSDSNMGIPDLTIPMGQGFVGHVALSRKPILVSDVKKNKSHLSTVAQVIGFEAKNLIATPIIIRNNLFGVFELINRLEIPVFSSSDVELLTYFSDLASKAIEGRLMIAWAKKESFLNSMIEKSFQKSSEPSESIEVESPGEAA